MLILIIFFTRLCILHAHKTSSWNVSAMYVCTCFDPYTTRPGRANKLSDANTLLPDIEWASSLSGQARAGYRAPAQIWHALTTMPLFPAHCGVCAQVFCGIFYVYTRSLLHTYINTYHSRFILEGVAEASQIFLRDAHVLPKLVSYEIYCRRDKWYAHRRLITLNRRSKCH
jgi:hypothetical protein